MLFFASEVKPNLREMEMNHEHPKLTGIQWLICIVAALGFAFDIYEILVLPLIIRPALTELGGLKLGTPEFGYWRDLLFYVPAVCGGSLRFIGWLFNGSAWPEKSFGLVHSSLRLFGFCCGICNITSMALIFPLHNFCRSLC